MDDAKLIAQKIRNFTSRENRLTQDKEQLLYAQGWRHTSSFPDHCWRWVKQIDEKLVVTVPSLNVDEALQLEAAYLARAENAGFDVACPHCKSLVRVKEIPYQRVDCWNCHTGLEISGHPSDTKVAILPDNPSPIAKGALDAQS